jgi:hypothetical protein
VQKEELAQLWVARALLFALTILRLTQVQSRSN